MSYRNTAVAARKEKKAGRVGLTEEQKQEIREAFDLVSSTNLCSQQAQELPS
jgi:centrin-1